MSATGDVTTLGRGGSDTSAIALASALGLSSCDIFTDVPGVFTADPRVVPRARLLESVSHEEMLLLSDAGAGVLQTRAVEWAAAQGIDIHVRSSFTFEPGTWVRRRAATLEEARVCGVAHRFRDPLYTLTGVAPAEVSAALARRNVALGSMVSDDRAVRLTVPGTDPAQFIAMCTTLGGNVAVHDGLGSVSVVSATAANRSQTIATVLRTLERIGTVVHLVGCTRNRMICHVQSTEVQRAAQSLHDAFFLHDAEVSTRDVATIERTPIHA
jgi:aspartate kinase